jgi:hypothetical protein
LRPVVRSLDGRVVEWLVGRLLLDSNIIAF